HDYLLIDLPYRQQRSVGFFGSTLRRMRPDQAFAGIPILRQRHGEHEHLPAREEIGWLPTIAAGLKTVLGPERDGQTVVSIPVEVPEVQRVGAVGISHPALVGRSNI